MLITLREEDSFEASELNLARPLSILTRSVLMSFAMAHLLSLPNEEVATPDVFTPRSLEVALNPLTVSAPPSKLTLSVSLPSRFVPLYPAVLARVSICVRSPSYCTARSLRAEVTVSSTVTFPML